MYMPHGSLRSEDETATDFGNTLVWHGLLVCGAHIHRVRAGTYQGEHDAGQELLQSIGNDDGVE